MSEKEKKSGVKSGGVRSEKWSTVRSEKWRSQERKVSVKGKKSLE